MPTALVAMANFKGTLANTEATSIVAHALHDLGFTPKQLPIGDGGQGTRLALQTKTGGELKNFGLSSVLFFPNSENPDWAYIESTETCGRSVVLANPETALTASSFRLGETLALLFEKIPASLKQLYIGLGDSGISDVGVGMLEKLGFQFLDDAERKLPPLISEMQNLAKIQLPENRPWKNLEVTVLCDVKNPLCGTEGSARVFSPQKGGTPEQVEILERSMERMALVFEKQLGKSVAQREFCGSVGGLASAFYAGLGARLVPGAAFLFDLLEIEKALEDADLVITGEGKTDIQTLSGKAPFEFLKRASEKDIPTYFFSGSLGTGYEKLLENENLAGIYASGTEPTAAIALFEKVKEVFK